MAGPLAGAALDEGEVVEDEGAGLDEEVVMEGVGEFEGVVVVELIGE